MIKYHFLWNVFARVNFMIANNIDPTLNKQGNLGIEVNIKKSFY